MDCIFCKIANGQLDTTLVYEDESLVAFSDLNAQAPHHKLIIPRQHIATLNDTDSAHTQLLGQMMLVANKLAHQLTIANDGYRCVLNCNAHGGQSVYHIHLHLLGGRPMKWPPG